MSIVSLNGVAIASPSDIRLGIVRLERIEVLASGLTAIDTIAFKRTVQLIYEGISETELKPILDSLEAATFHTLVYPDPQAVGGQRTITAHVSGEISSTAWLMRGNVRYWVGTAIGLRER